MKGVGMSSELIQEEVLIVRLEPELKQRLKLEAVKQRTDMSKITRRALQEHLRKLETQRRRSEAHGEKLVEALRGRGTGKLSTDEIMALTRGE
jgi:predicted transcriptional regulator